MYTVSSEAGIVFYVTEPRLRLASKLLRNNKIMQMDAMLVQVK